MTFQATATRIWKRLTPQERLAAATHFWQSPPEETTPGALSAIVQVRRMRPQVVRTLPPETRARYLASILEPGETVAASLLIALHLGERRALLSAFLDALELPHENGLLKEEAFETRPTIEKAREAVKTLAAAFPPHELETYLNTLYLQDPDHWQVLAESSQWLPRIEDRPQSPVQ
jgi:hypothetical protein